MNNASSTMQLIDRKGLINNVAVFTYITFVKVITWLGVINESEEDDEEGGCGGCQCGNGGCS